MHNPIFPVPTAVMKARRSQGTSMVGRSEAPIREIPDAMMFNFLPELLLI